MNTILFINQSTSLLHDYPPSVGPSTKKGLPSVIEIPYVVIRSMLPQCVGNASNIVIAHILG